MVSRKRIRLKVSRRVFNLARSMRVSLGRLVRYVHNPQTSGFRGCPSARVRINRHSLSAWSPCHPISGRLFQRVWTRYESPSREVLQCAIMMCPSHPLWHCTSSLGSAPCASQPRTSNSFLLDDRFFIPVFVLIIRPACCSRLLSRV